MINLDNNIPLRQILQEGMDYEVYALNNGIRLVHKSVNSLVAHVGLLMNTGSRDEKEEEHGIAHFIEHSLFKGTRKRKAWHILNRLDSVGGEINAFTTKEETCIYASFLKQDYPRALELIQDIVFQATFPEQELLLEKEVIIDEINAYEDNPSELIFDDFEALVYKGHPMGRNILGTPVSLEKITRGEIGDFINRNYATDEMILCSVGNISFKKLVGWMERFYGELPGTSRLKARAPAKTQSGISRSAPKDIFQAHCIMGGDAYDAHDDKRFALHLLNNILGGPAMNSRLNLQLREKRGYSYHTESNYHPYSDSGILNVYFGTEKNKLAKTADLVLKEFKNLREKKLGDMQLRQAKKQLTGQLAIAAENNESLMLSMARSFLLYEHIEPLEKVAARIESIQKEELMDTARELLDEDRLNILKYT